MWHLNTAGTVSCAAVLLRARLAVPPKCRTFSLANRSDLFRSTSCFTETVKNSCKGLKVNTCIWNVKERDFKMKKRTTGESTPAPVSKFSRPQRQRFSIVSCARPVFKISRRCSRAETKCGEHGTCSVLQAVVDSIRHFQAPPSLSLFPFPLLSKSTSAD